MVFTNRPRVLVSTVGPWSDVGADTWSMLLSHYDKTKVASLYLRAEKSKSPRCCHYFHIFEERVMKSIFLPTMRTGEEYYYDSDKNDNDFTESSSIQKKEKERYAKYSKHKNWFTTTARELVWLLGNWKSKEFKRFLDEFDPEVLVFPIESYIHLNRINKYIIKKTHPKVIGFLNDDNFTFKQSKKLGDKLHRIWQRKSVRWLVKHCDTVFTICPKMKRECDEAFGIKSSVLSKPMVCDSEFVPYQPNNPIRLLYAGKLYINRDKTIAIIARAIKRVNEQGERVVMDVYSGTYLSTEMISAIECSPSVHFNGQISNKQVFEEMKKSDVLLFVEDLSEENLIARLSFSTKITDCFGSGKCTWAVGNRDLGAVEYIKEMDAGFVTTSEEEVYETLKLMINKPEMISEYARKGYECGIKYHNVERLTDIFEEAILD